MSVQALDSPTTSTPPRNEPPELRIFLSHKLGDADMARKLKKRLLDHGPNLHVFTAGEIRAGEEWEPTLEEELVAAHWLVLLYTSSDEVWDWCLYETGFFRGKHFDPSADRAVASRFRLICLHPGELDPPTPFKSWISVPTTKAAKPGRTAGGGDKRRARMNLNDWLREIYDGTGGYRAVNPEFVKEIGEDSGFAKLANDIAAFVQPPLPHVDVDTFFRTFELELTPAQMKELKSTRQLPADTGVVAPKDTMEDIFSLAASDDPERMTWASFLEQITDETQRAWLRSIPPCIVRLNDTKLGSPFLPLLCNSGSEPGPRRSLYRPIITERRRAKGHWTRFEVVLASTPDTIQLDAAQKVDVLSHLLLLGRTFRWGILVPSLSKLERAQARDFGSILEQVITEIDFAVIECEARGVKVANDVERLLSPKTVQFYLDRVWRPWSELYPKLLQCAEECRKGGSAVRESIATALQIVREILDLNGLFMTIASQRLAELMTEEPLVPRAALQELRQLLNGDAATAGITKASECDSKGIVPPDDPAVKGSSSPRRGLPRSRKPKKS